jgi:hypothetical protein
LNIDYNENIPIEQNVIDLINKSNIETIYFHNDFNQPIDILPQKLNIFRIGENFNYSLDSFPTELKTLGVFCNVVIDNLPEKLESLHISGKFTANFRKMS